MQNDRDVPRNRLPSSTEHSQLRISENDSYVNPKFSITPKSTGIDLPQIAKYKRAKQTARKHMEDANENVQVETQEYLSPGARDI